MRPAEPAQVIDLKYTLGQDAEVDTMAVMRLALDDAASPLAGREFEVEMPPPHHGQAEFVVLRSRFEASVARGWAGEDKCQVCWLFPCFLFPQAQLFGQGITWEKERGR